MVNTFPKVFSEKAIRIYIVLLASMLPLARGCAMKWYFMAIGLLGVYAFFHYSTELPVRWRRLDSLRFEKKLFKTAFIIRLVFVLASAAFYTSVTGTMFGFEGFDAVGYHEQGMNGHWILVNSPSDYWTCMLVGDYADSGYSMYLSLVYTLFGDNVLPARVIKALLGAAMCSLVYKLASRNFDEATGRLAGIMFMLMPNGLYYCGSHLKETEMVFLVLLFAERADFLLRSRHYSVWQFVGVFLLASSLFFFRTALAVVLIISFVMAGLMTSTRIVGVVKKSLVITASVIGSVIILGTGIAADITHEWGRREEQETNYEWRAERGGGNYLIKYASAAVFAPLIFTIPCPTMVAIPGQEHTQMVHSGNYVKNIISVFTILALIVLVMSGRWRDHVLILSIMLGYLAVLAISQFAQSERFHYPALPFIIMFAAYGITHLKRKHIRYFNVWVIVIFFAGLAWNFIKLKGRGMI